MGRIIQEKGEKGSLKWIQYILNDHPNILDSSISKFLPDSHNQPIEWLSPLADDDYAEYKDQTFLDLLEIKLTKKELKDFWPSQGPQWDALATFGDDGVILVEAKAHINEMLSPGSQASAESLEKINKALNRTKRFYKAKPGCDWSKRFYQYANRLAHLYFLRELNGIDAYLVFVNFLNDPDLDGPKTEREWCAAIKVMHEALGVRGEVLKKHVIDVFVDVGGLG